MKSYITAFVFLMLSSVHAFGHEMTPTYPELRPSYTDGLYSVSMKLFNRRDDVTYYEISVFDDEWKKIPFASRDNLINIGYLEKVDFEIFIRERDRKKVEYICTTSKLLKDNLGTSAVNSRICSKIKRD